MSFTSNEYARVASALHSGTCSDEVLSLLQVMCDQKQAHAVIKALISCEPLADQPDGKVVRQSLSKLEILNSRSELLGCILMVDLWSIANDYSLHDVCNSIDLWIDHCHSEKLAEYLKAFNESETRAGLKDHSATWLKET